MVAYSLKETLLQTLQSKPKNTKIGLVPTMGALHLGHLSLLKKALSENDCVVVSIFVNPTQFNNPSDLKKYPRTLEADLALLASIKGDILVFTPEISEIYNQSVISKKYNFGGLGKVMEGKHRVGHFDGVGTVLNILFRIINPNKAYFGEKDYQQLQIVKKLAAIEKLPVQIIGCPIFREANGLAMSSRNKRLSQTQLEKAGLIHKTLREVKSNFKTLSIPQSNLLVKERFLNNPYLELEYFEIAKSDTLKTAKRKMKNTEYRAFIAVFAGEVRLIDNIPLN